MTKEETPIYLKNTLKSLRTRIGLDQQKASELLGISQPTLRSWEKNSSQLTWDDIQKVCKVYRIPQDYIFFGTDNAFCEKILQEV